MRGAIAGRRALPYSEHVEDSTPVRQGRRKARYRDRPRMFETHEAAVWFATQRARNSGRRQRVARQFGPQSLPVWAVREITAPRLTLVRSATLRSLEQMERLA